VRALLLLVLSIGACSALDDFSIFTFDGGGAPADGGSDASPILAPFGAACTANGCMQYTPSKPVMCETVLNSGGGGGITFPDGMCTRPCTAALNACTEFGVGVADCGQVGNGNFCLPHCNPTANQSCRSGYACCLAGKPTNGPGLCVPATECH
jgi:hypothetical protein